MKIQSTFDHFPHTDAVDAQPYKRIALLVAPPLLLVTTYLAFQGFVALWGSQIGYFAGFLVYWVLWCLLFSLWILGKGGLSGLFQRAMQLQGRHNRLLLLLLIWPPLLAATTVLPAKFAQITGLVLAGSAALAVVNATLEEVLWRGAYIHVFPDSKFWGWIYPSIGFALWHIVPLSVHNNSMPGGMASYLAGALVIGLSYGWVAWRTGSIRWTVMSHVVMNFLGMGATIYFAT
jgi:uncharacterized protein